MRINEIKDFIYEDLPSFYKKVFKKIEKEIKYSYNLSNLKLGDLKQRDIFISLLDKKIEFYKAVKKILEDDKFFYDDVKFVMECLLPLTNAFIIKLINDEDLDNLQELIKCFRYNHISEYLTDEDMDKLSESFIKNKKKSFLKKNISIFSKEHANIFLSKLNFKERRLLLLKEFSLVDINGVEEIPESVALKNIKDAVIKLKNTPVKKITSYYWAIEKEYRRKFLETFIESLDLSKSSFKKFSKRIINLLEIHNKHDQYFVAGNEKLSDKCRKFVLMINLGD